MVGLQNIENAATSVTVSFTYVQFFFCRLDVLLFDPQ